MSDRWGKYYDVTSGRKPRDLFLEGFEAVPDGLPQTSTEIGFGAGNEVLFLLDQGWNVLAIDAEDEAGVRLSNLVGESKGLTILIESFENIEYPMASLVHAGYSLPFCQPEHFENVWSKIISNIPQEGIFCGQLFGVNDAWSSNDSMTFHTRDDVDRLLEQFEVLHLEETDEVRGTATGGNKHWHLFDIIARKQ